MLRRLWPQAMGPTSLLLVGLLMASCGGAATPAPQEATAPTQEVAAVPTLADTSPTAASQEAAATQESVATAEVKATTEVSAAPTEIAAAPAGPAVCQPVQIPANEKVAPISAKDWANGPATAPVTVIEYGDFQ